MAVSTRLRDSVFTETHGLENALKVNVNENTCICPLLHSSNVVSARALENVDLKRVISAAVSIATLIWHDLEPNMQDKQFLVPMANLIICF